MTPRRPEPSSRRPPHPRPPRRTRTDAAAPSRPDRPRGASRSAPLALVLLALGSLQCAGAPSGITAKPAPVEPPTLLVHEAPAVPEGLVFPPPANEGRHRRPPLPEAYAQLDVHAPLRVLSPAPNDAGEVIVRTTPLRVRFSRSMAGAEPGAPAGDLVTIEPAVAVEARWTDAQTIEITPAKPFEPKVGYRLSVASATGADGSQLAQPFSVPLRAVPIVVVAGKTLDYLPAPGEPRVVVVRPDPTTVGRSPTFSVLYDQAVDLAAARSLVELRQVVLGQGPSRHLEPIPVRLSYPPRDELEGIRVDRRFVVVARPVKPLDAGASIELSARSVGAPAGDEETVVRAEVAEPLRTAGVSCGYWHDEEHCAFEPAPNGDVLYTDGKQVHVSFNNRIGIPDDRLRGHVQIAPPVRNLSVSETGWSEGRIVLSGDFRPSTSYQVALTGLRDVFGSRLPAPIRFRVETDPIGASVTIPEGLFLLDAEAARSFPLHCRNVAEVELGLWPVPGSDASAFRRALRGVADQDLDPVRAPRRISIPVQAKANELVVRTVDLTSELGMGSSWLLTARPSRFTYGARAMRFPSGSEASRPAVALVRIGQPGAVAVHVHRATDTAVVQVARLRTGEPVAGAAVSLDGSTAAPARTDPFGVVALRLPAELPEPALLRVQAGSEQLLLPAAQGAVAAEDLFPSLAAGAMPDSADRRAIVVTDRGIYRPKSDVEVRASAYRLESQGFKPLAGTLLRLRVVGPTGETVASPTLLTGALGSSATRVPIGADAKLGKYELVLEDPLRPSTPLARSWIRVAEFEAPRFAVDVLVDQPSDAPGTQRDAERRSSGSATLGATVRGRYLFGTAMDGADVSWTLRRSQAELPAGPLTAAGLSFRAEPRWYDDDETDSRWSRTGEGTLDSDGLLRLDQPIALDPEGGPQRFELEADVADRSHRHVAGRASVVRHPVARYAGIKGPRGWVDVGQSIGVELGVVDTSGKAVLGATATARLQRLSWQPVRQRMAGGAVRTEWKMVRQDAGRCSVKAAEEPRACSLRIDRSGDYEVVAEVDGRPGGRLSFWAWRDGDRNDGPVPTRGSVLPVVTDKASYDPGDRAKLMLRNPYPAAIAVVTTEMGGVLSHESKRVAGPVGVIEVPILESHAPYVHATVTLLPIGASGEDIASHRIAAVRLPVSLEAARLDLDVRTDRASYQPGDDAEISLWVRDHGRPEPRAEVALAVVDEGVLRLTGFHPPDPAVELRPGSPLAFQLIDTRLGLAELVERSHVPGGGEMGEDGAVATARRNFVETALWRPLLRTDEQGQIRVRFKLPDNLTEFRIMAVALDDEGRGARAESSFQVRKPVMLDPVLPRFASVGDRFEVAAMVHNTGTQPFHGIVRLGERSKPVSVQGGSRQRVGFATLADRPGTMSFDWSVADTAGVRDRVVRSLRVEQPGISQRPRLAGAFQGNRTIALRVPADAIEDGDGSLHVKVGQHLWPELGARLEYLLDFPHGCVEQTTSGTLPLLAARDILPRIGFTRLGEAALRERIQAGIRRLATMRTPGGGLAYWPGGDKPNVYGTAYAIRAVILAKEAGVAPPEGMLEGMAGYLASALSDDDLPAEVRLAIAHSLSELDQLPASKADALFELAADGSVFGKASLALGLARLGNQKDRVDRLVTAIEKEFTAEGTLEKEPNRNDFSYFGSSRRSQAQSAIALARLRPTSPLLPLLVNDLARQTEGYTTQATAYSLLALAEHLRQSAVDGADFELRLDGSPVAVARELGIGSREFVLPLAELRGRERALELRGPEDVAVAYLLEASYRQPLVAGGAGPSQDGDAPVATGSPRAGASVGAGSAPAPQPSPGALVATTARHGPSIYRVYSDVAGNPIDIGRVQSGDVVRVALLVRMPDSIPSSRRGFLAITDRLPAGFEPVDPDLATVAQVPELSEHHPFSQLLRWSSSTPSHVELRDDRVNVYFDEVWGEELAATYLARAITPGQYVLPPASAELMYEPDSLSYSESSTVVVQ